MNSHVKKNVVKRSAKVLKNSCVACGTCMNVCPIGAIKINAGVFAVIDKDKCTGCAKCAKECPASVIEMAKKKEVE
ncbi:MAG: 4Fe-4S dicluster-binding protein [Clostridia bacterium]